MPRGARSANPLSAAAEPGGATMPTITPDPQGARVRASLSGGPGRDARRLRHPASRSSAARSRASRPMRQGPRGRDARRRPQRRRHGAGRQDLRDQQRRARVRGATGQALPGAPGPTTTRAAASRSWIPRREVRDALRPRATVGSSADPTISSSTGRAGSGSRTWARRASATATAARSTTPGPTAP